MWPNPQQNFIFCAVDSADFLLRDVGMLISLKGCWYVDIVWYVGIIKDSEDMLCWDDINLGDNSLPLLGLDHFVFDTLCYRFFHCN